MGILNKVGKMFKGAGDDIVKGSKKAAGTKLKINSPNAKVSDNVLRMSDNLEGMRKNINMVNGFNDKIDDALNSANRMAKDMKSAVGDVGETAKIKPSTYGDATRKADMFNKNNIKTEDNIRKQAVREIKGNSMGQDTISAKKRSQDNLSSKKLMNYDSPYSSGSSTTTTRTNLNNGTKKTGKLNINTDRKRYY